MLAILRHGDVLIPASELKRAGMSALNYQVVLVDGQEYVALSQLAPSITYTFDERNLALRVVAQSQHFDGTFVDMQSNRPPGVSSSKNTSAFFNYAFDLQDFKHLSEFSELGVSSRGNLYYTGFAFQPNGRLVRGLSNITFDNPARLKRWIVGDTFASGGELGGSSFLGGVTVARNFDLNPYFIRYPGVGVSGAVMTPSIAEIYVNGYLVGTQQLQPGKFDINNIPLIAGAGNTQVVVRDAFGRTQTLSRSYYYSTAVLQRGLSDYSYSAGARRSNIGSLSGDYGKVVFIGRDRVGLTDWFTAGGRLEAGTNFVSAGPSATIRLGSGQLSLDAALSRASGLSGGAAAANYSFLNRRLSYGASLATVGSHYATASLLPTEDRATSAGAVFAGFSIGPRSSLSVNFAASNSRDSGPSQDITLAGTTRLSNRFDLIVTGDHSHNSPGFNANRFFLALNYQLGNNTLAAITSQGGANGAGSGFSVQRSLPLGTGTGYRISQGTGSEIHADNLVQYQTSFGLYQAANRQQGGGSHNALSASGGLVDAGNGIMLTRAVESGFAVIDLPNLRGVRGYVNNQLVGRTDKKGRLLIPNLLPYYANRVQISDQDVPLDYSVQATEETVSPPYRGGSLLRFPVQRVTAVTGTLVVDAARTLTVPSFGQLRVTIAGHPVLSELGRGGEFYLENVSAGEYSAVVEYDGGRCAFQLIVPKRQAAVTEVGRLRCTPPQISGTTPR